MIGPHVASETELTRRRARLLRRPNRIDTELKKFVRRYDRHV
jgi:hypothetical protein